MENMFHPLILMPLATFTIVIGYFLYRKYKVDKKIENDPQM